MVPLDGDIEGLIRILPEYSGCGEHLREFWAAFASIELRPLLLLTRVPNSDKVLDTAKRRCVEATYAFNIVIELLETKWKPRLTSQPGSSNSKSREVAIADRNAEHWDVLLIVQRLLGRSFPSPAWGRVEAEIQERREIYLQQARSFQFIAAVLTHSWDATRKKERQGDVQQIFIDKVTALIVAQQAIPPDWQVVFSIGECEEQSGTVGIESCWTRG